MTRLLTVGAAVALIAATTSVASPASTSPTAQSGTLWVIFLDDLHSSQSVSGQPHEVPYRIYVSVSTAFDRFRSGAAGSRSSKSRTWLRA